jgi:hypothetical protein
MCSAPSGRASGAESFRPQTDMRLPEVRLIATDDYYCLEFSGTISSVFKVEMLRCDEDESWGWIYPDVDLYWPPHAYSAYAGMIADHVVKRGYAQTKLPRWKEALIAKSLGIRISCHLKKLLANFNTEALVRSGSISKNIKYSSWNLRAYDHSTGVAFAQHIKAGLPLRPCLVVSMDIGSQSRHLSLLGGLRSHKNSEERWVWSMGSPQWHEDCPEEALVASMGENARFIIVDLLRTSHQLWPIKISKWQGAMWPFLRACTSEDDAKVLTTAFTLIMSPCSCCIGDDLDLYIARCRKMMEMTGKKGFRVALEGKQVCTGECAVAECGDNHPVLIV